MGGWLVWIAFFIPTQLPGTHGSVLSAPPAPFTEAKFREYVAYLADDKLAGRDVGSAGDRQAADYMIQCMEKFGVRPLDPTNGWLQKFTIKLPRRGSGREDEFACGNILGVVPGAGALADQAVIVSTHHDHIGVDQALIKAGKDGIFNGADDNASGCAAVLLMAEALLADQGHMPPSRRTVIFASFDAEEKGLRGARYYVTHPLWPLERTTACINFDMIGRADRGRVFAFDSRSNPFLADHVMRHGVAAGLQPETRLNNPGRSDHVNFLEREIPSLHFCTGLHADYHQPSDETSRVDCASGARIAWVAYQLLLDVAALPGRLPYHSIEGGFDVKTLLALLFKIGIVPEQNSQKGRYPLLRYVFPGGIAAKSGLFSGDEITAIDGKEFERVEDFVLVFGRVRFREGLLLTVLRAGKKQEIRIPGALLKDFAGPDVRKLNTGKFEAIFRFKPPMRAKTGVFLVGGFNHWNPSANPMKGPDTAGEYEARLVLPAGMYEYKFVVDQETDWRSDPTNLRTAGRYKNSVLVLGDEP